MESEKEIKAGIGSRLKKIRETFCFSQSRMSRILNISRSHYSGMENGMVLPPPDIFKRLKETLDINPYWLFSGSGEKFTTGFSQSLIRRQDKETFKTVEPGDEIEHEQIQDLLYFISKDRVAYHNIMEHFFKVKINMESFN